MLHRRHAILQRSLLALNHIELHSDVNGAAQHSGVVRENGKEVSVG